MADLPIPDVVILGAGFSRAVSVHVPVGNPLGQMALDRARFTEPDLFKAVTTFSDDYPFEVWLSQLADDQPHLGAVENGMSRVRFAAVREALVGVLREVEALALATQPPDWFYQLLTVWHLNRTTLISFNYDTRVEAGVASICLEPSELRAPSLADFDDFRVPSMPASTAVSPDELFHGQPPLIDPDPATPGTMRLLKLHGSLGWWWVDGDESGATVARERVSSSFGDPQEYDDAVRRSILPGRVPFIIPPLASKSAYYSNPVTRQLWQDAFESLRDAASITIFGYSLPRNDTIVGSMLQAALDGSDTAIEVVNPDGIGVVQRLSGLGVRSVASRFDDAGLCAKQYAAAVCARASALLGEAAIPLLAKARTESEDAAVVRWSRNGGAAHTRVVAMTTGADASLTLDTEETGGLFSSAAGDGPTVRVVLGALEHARSVWARYPDGQVAPVVGLEAPNFDSPHARHILYLVPAGQLQ